MFSEAQCRQERQRRKTGCDKSCEWSELPSAPPYQQRPRHMHGWHGVTRPGAAVHCELKFARSWKMSWEAGSKNVQRPEAGADLIEDEPAHATHSECSHQTTAQTSAQSPGIV